MNCPCIHHMPHTFPMEGYFVHFSMNPVFRNSGLIFFVRVFFMNALGFIFSMNKITSLVNPIWKFKKYPWHIKFHLLMLFKYQFLCVERGRQYVYLYSLATKVDYKYGWLTSFPFLNNKWVIYYNSISFWNIALIWGIFAVFQKCYASLRY